MGEQPLSPEPHSSDDATPAVAGAETAFEGGSALRRRRALSVGSLFVGLTGHTTVEEFTTVADFSVASAGIPVYGAEVGDLVGWDVLEQEADAITRDRARIRQLSQRRPFARRIQAEQLSDDF